MRDYQRGLLLQKVLRVLSADGIRVITQHLRVWIMVQYVK